MCAFSRFYIVNRTHKSSIGCVEELCALFVWRLTMKKILICLITLFTVIFCAGCSSSNVGYYPRISRADLKKTEHITVSVGGVRYDYDATDSDFYAIRDVIASALRSGNIDSTELISGKVKMPCNDSAVENEKASADIWIEMFMEGGNYKKIFFTIDSTDTQSIWIYSTASDSYNDGSFLKHRSCDCRALVALITSFGNE